MSNSDLESSKEFSNLPDTTGELFHRSESDLLVFISSVMSEEMDWARTSAKQAIEALDYGRPWAFEFTSASSESLEEGVPTESCRSRFRDLACG